MNKQLFPIIVFSDHLVGKCIVVYSLITLLSPIIISPIESSFRCCASVPIQTPGPISLPEPIETLSQFITADSCILFPSPSSCH